jgi:hypothetical protein
MTDRELMKAMANPAGREIQIGRAILSLRNGQLPPDYPSLLSLLKKTSAVDYSYVMKWARAAEFVDDTDPERAEWGISRLLEILRISDPTAREAFLAGVDPSRLSVRRLRDEVRQFLVEQPLPQYPTAPHEVVAEAVRIALQREGLDRAEVGLEVREAPKSAPPGSVTVTTQVTEPRCAKALAVASGVLEEIATVRAVWRSHPPADATETHWALPLEEVDRLRPGALKVRWTEQGAVQVFRDGSLIIHLPVRRDSIDTIAHPQGNHKTSGVCGIINSIHLGCLRRATGFVKCNLPCYAADDGSGGCFSTVAQSSRHDDGAPHSPNVIHNGVTNDLLKITLPVMGSADLSRYKPRDRQCDPMVWRVDAESADGAMGIALGNIQMWAESNPHMRFLTICSHAVSPSDAMLCWLAGLRNVWVGTSASVWFDRAELDQRFAAVRRFLDFGIPSVIWITTAPDWDNQPVLERALSLVPPDCIVEYPLWGIHQHELPVLHANPKGACGDHRIDRGGRGWVVQHGEGTGNTRLDPEGHDFERQWSSLRSVCRGCQLRCGLPGVESRLRPAETGGRRVTG